MSARDDGAVARRLALNAARGASFSSDAEHVNAFLTRYGTAAEIGEQLHNVARLREFFTKHVGERIAAAAGDGEVLDGLNVVAARLRDLHERAEQYQWLMDLLGWQFDRQERTLKYARPGRRGPKKSVVSMMVAALFERMVAGGRPKENSTENREIIRQHLAGKGFGADVVTDGKIEDALTDVLFPDRHYKKKKP